MTTPLISQQDKLAHLCKSQAVAVAVQCAALRNQHQTRNNGNSCGAITQPGEKLGYLGASNPLLCVVGVFLHRPGRVRWCSITSPPAPYALCLAEAEAEEPVGRRSQHSRSCSANRGHLIYNRIFARSRTPKCATPGTKLGLGGAAVHVRSRLFPRFFGVGPPKNKKKAILCEKGAYCELVSSLSSLDTASERERRKPAIRRVLGASGNIQPTRGHAGTHEGPRAATTRATRTSQSGTYGEPPPSSSSSWSEGAASLSSSPCAVRALALVLPAGALAPVAHVSRKFA